MQCLRGNGGARVASRERPHPQGQRHPPHTKGKSFTIASTSTDEDDEWVSSESGAATPNDPDPGSSRSPTPVDRRNGFMHDEMLCPPDTPRARHPPPPVSVSLSRASTIHASESQSEVLSGAAAVLSRVPLSPSAVSPPEHRRTPQLSSGQPLLMASRSENTSPVHRHSAKKRASTCSSSPYTITSRLDGSLHPHPLIRGQPLQARPEPLTPLTVTSDVSSVQTSSSPTYDAGQLSTSPSSVKTTSAEPSNRRTSISSVRSVATLPSQAYHLGKEYVRDRTLSSMSSTSSISVQALASLAQLPATRPPTPQYSVHFPPASLSAALEVVHSLLPPPYLSAHMSVLAHRSPLRESFDRVVTTRGKQRQ